MGGFGLLVWNQVVAGPCLIGLNFTLNGRKQVVSLHPPHLSLLATKTSWKMGLVPGWKIVRKLDEFYKLNETSNFNLCKVAFNQGNHPQRKIPCQFHSQPDSSPTPSRPLRPHPNQFMWQKYRFILCTIPTAFSQGYHGHIQFIYASAALGSTSKAQNATYFFYTFFNYQFPQLMGIFLTVAGAPSRLIFKNPDRSDALPTPC